MTQPTADNAKPPDAASDSAGRPKTGKTASDPIKIRAYGLVPLTKTAYLRVQVVAFAVFLLALIASLVLPVPAGWQEYPLFEFMPLIVAGLGVLEGIETLLMLRKFREKENERRTSTFPA